MSVGKKLLPKIGLILALLAGSGSLSVFAEKPGEAVPLEPISAIYEPYSGISLFTDDYSSYYPALTEGNHEKWIDRIELPEDIRELYRLLEKGSDNDGVDDFLIDPDSSDLVKDVMEYSVDSVNGTAARGLKIADIRGTGTSWTEAAEAAYDKFYNVYNKARTVCEAFDRDHAEVFWLNGGCYISTLKFESEAEYNEETEAWNYTYTSEVYFMLESDGYDWSIWSDKYRDPELIRSTIDAVEQQVETIVSEAGEKTPAEYVRYFNEWLTMNNEYNYYVGNGVMNIEEVAELYPDVFECTAALFGSTGYSGPVCESYSRALKVLCDRVEIPCVIVDGYALNSDDAEGEAHMWNYVEVNGKWYAVDVTWNDPNWGEEGAVSGSEREDYLLIGADTETMIGYAMMRFIESHPVSNQPYGEGTLQFTNGPVLNSTAYEPLEGYAVALSEDVSVNVGEQAQVAITVYSEETSYNAYYYVLTYDPEVLTYQTISEDAMVWDNHGTLTVLGYGEDKALNEEVVLNFLGKAPEGGDVRLIEANIDQSENANVQDAPSAVIQDALTNIAVDGYKVTLADDFLGAGAVNAGEDYTFSAKNPYYTYTVTALMDGTAVAVIVNEDGTFTVPEVTGSLVITAEKVPMNFAVTVEGNGQEDVTLSTDRAAYMTDYTFEAVKEEGYLYQITVEIGGVSYNPVVSEAGAVYEIAGKDITGDIVIHITKTQAPAETTQIIFVGNGSSDITGANPAVAANDQDFEFTIDKEEYYDYVVQLTEPLQELLPDSEGVYVIGKEQLNGNELTVQVTKTFNAERVVEVCEYVKIQDGKSIFLITISGSVIEENAFAYDGNVMSYSDEYEAYAYLVISDRSLPEIQEQAEDMITEITLERVMIEYNGDVNATGRIDINDVQLTYNMYNAYYSDFTVANMDQFLRADMNHDKMLSVLDCAAIVEKLR